MSPVFGGLAALSESCVTEADGKSSVQGQKTYHGGSLSGLLSKNCSPVSSKFAVTYLNNVLLNNILKRVIIKYTVVPNSNNFESSLYIK